MFFRFTALMRTVRRFCGNDCGAGKCWRSSRAAESWATPAAPFHIEISHFAGAYSREMVGWLTP
jgi:hypothetical protein